MTEKKNKGNYKKHILKKKFKNKNKNERITLLPRNSLPNSSPLG
jgi:hypothetical protein